MLDSIWKSLELDPHQHEPSPAEERRYDMLQSVMTCLHMIAEAYPELTAAQDIDNIQEEKPLPDPETANTVDYVADTTDRSVEKPLSAAQLNTEEGLSVHEMQQQVQAALEAGPANPLFELK